MDIEKAFLTENPLTFRHLTKINGVIKNGGCLSYIGPKGFGGRFYMEAARRQCLKRQGRPIDVDIDCRLVASKVLFSRIYDFERSTELSLCLSHFEALPEALTLYLKELYDAGKIKKMILFSEYDSFSERELYLSKVNIFGNPICLQFKELSSDSLALKYYLEHFLLGNRNLSNDALRFVREYDWPGNFEQFFSLALKLKSRKKYTIDLDDITDLIDRDVSLTSLEFLNAVVSDQDLKFLVQIFGYPKIVRAIDASILNIFLKQYDGCQARAARFLSIAPTTFRSKVLKMGDLLLP